MLSNYRPTRFDFFTFPNPKRDQHQFSPNNSNTQLKEKFMRINIRENALIFEQILSTKSVMKCFEISLENLNVDHGA